MTYQRICGWYPFVISVSSQTPLIFCNIVQMVIYFLFFFVEEKFGNESTNISVPISSFIKGFMSTDPTFQMRSVSSQSIGYEFKSSRVFCMQPIDTGLLESKDDWPAIHREGKNWSGRAQLKSRTYKANQRKCPLYERSLNLCLFYNMFKLIFLLCLFKIYFLESK